MSEEADHFKLIFAFRDQSPSFSYGFTCGRIWQQMRTATVPFSETVMAELREDIIAMATASGWKENIKDITKDWIRVEFVREGAMT